MFACFCPRLEEHMGRRSSVVGGVLLLIAVGGCKCTPGESALIGPEGGRIEVRSGDTIVRLDVPVGAVARQVELSMRVLPQRLPEALSPTIEMLPHGTEFLIPVAIPPKRIKLQTPAPTSPHSTASCR